MAYHCTGCDNITLQPLGGFKPNPTEKNPTQTKAYLPAAPPVGEFCTNCNQRHHLGGPLWSAPIHDEAFVTRVLNHVENNPELFGTAKRIAGVLAMVREELLDIPLYHSMDRLLEADPVARYILAQEIKTQVDLNERADANPISRRDGRLRFQYNPTPHWGPGSRAAVNVGEEKMSKAIRNQNKYSKDKDKKNLKRPHSPSDEEEIKNVDTSSETAL
ncbi:hypothetical protein HF086_009278 [Spodoptera exigua]|uniref:tRNA (guanine(26)-N(2))-dimethyltransferase n=1 Tax=Spodoptera exigua TaxID=7107 RepID=A0A922MDK1_SPOEX|nr:hypothetical protein HF086_009278 [Spodoptera exigua]